MAFVNGAVASSMSSASQMSQQSACKGTVPKFITVQFVNGLRLSNKWPVDPYRGGLRGGALGAAAPPPKPQIRILSYNKSEFNRYFV